MAAHKNPKAEIKKLRAYARNTLQKDKRINIKGEGEFPLALNGKRH
jgi:hypothetical protein